MLTFAVLLGLGAFTKPPSMASVPHMTMNARSPAMAHSSELSDSDDALQLYRALRQGSEADTDLGRAIGGGLSILGDAFRLYRPEEVVTSFNGGKDAVVILHLMRAALAAHNEATGGSTRLRVIFFEMDDEFPEVDAFVRDAVNRYGLILTSYAGVGFAEGLGQCIEEHGSKAFVLGTRFGDPNAKGQQDFSPSSDWMPPFMRVNPVLQWGYADVWAFLRQYQLPYCSLYDEGYTSLGKVANTVRNPALLREDGTYGAAWELTDGSLERAGRISTKPAPAPDPNVAPAMVAESSPLHAETAALLIVGDEILGGKTSDGNTLVAARRLRASGIALRRVSVVSDEIGEIADELTRLSGKHDIVITSGGLGPTHDDVTLSAVAEALGMPMGRSDEMAGIITSRLAASPTADTPSADSLEKMARMPAGARLRTVPGDETAWPILQCGTVFVLPGVPELFAKKLATICAHFVQGKPPVLSRRVLLSAVETSLVDQLNRVVTAHPRVSFGSYPVAEGAIRTIVTLEAEADAADDLETALDALKAAMPPGSVESVDGAANLNVG